MDQILLEGFLLGLFLSIYCGASFFLMIETSITRGFREAFSLSMGVIVSDAIFVLLAVFLSAEILQFITESSYFRIISFIVFALFGLMYLLRKQEEKDAMLNQISHGQLFIKGFLINSINPFVPIFWLGAIVMVITNKNFSGNELILLFSTTLLTVILTNTLKIYFASHLKTFVNAEKRYLLNKAIGFLLIGFGFYILIAKHIKIS